MGDDFHLSISIPEAGAKLFRLKGDRAGVGRGVDNQVAIDFHSISGTHCEFRRSKNGYAIVDLGSTNGTRVNGKKAPPNAPLPLEDGDRILLSEQVAIYFYRVKEGQAPPSASATESTDAASLKTAQTLADLGTRITAMKEQEAELAAGIATMKAEFEARQKKVAKVEDGMKQLESELETKRATASGTKADQQEISAMEEELVGVTRKWKLMASDLEGQQAQLESLGEAVAAPVSTAGPLKVAPLAPAAPLSGSQSTQKLVEAKAAASQSASPAKGTLAKIVQTTGDSVVPVASAEPASPAKTAQAAKKAAQAVKAAVPAKKAAQAVKAAVPAKKAAQAVKAAVPAKKAAQALKAAVPTEAAEAVKAAVPAEAAQAVKAAVPAKKAAQAVKAAAPAQAVKAAVALKAANPAGPGQPQPTVALKRAAGGVPILKKAPAKKSANPKA